LKFANFFELTDEDWLDSFNVNLLSAVRVSRVFVPSLKNSGAPRIINISSIMAAKPGGHFPHYSAMKAGLSNFTVSLAHTLAGDNIPVNCVSPGPVWSRSWENEAVEIAKKSGLELPKIQENLRAESGKLALLNRMGVPEDVTGLVLFLASDHARWITASDFTVDGGILCNPF
jgi:NAD(P)-dependent dehydrogenase (short-subunit alcohol dehydrogenase family)